MSLQRDATHRTTGTGIRSEFADLTQQHSVENDDRVALGQCDDVALLEGREGSADGLDAEAEVLADLVARDV